MTAKRARELFAEHVDRAKDLREVAERLKVSIPYVSMIKNGKADPGLAVAARIEKEYGIPASAWAGTKAA